MSGKEFASTMFITKIITCLLGLGLLFPITASFWLMIRYQPMTEAELQQQLNETLEQVKADIDAQVEPGFSGAMLANVQIERQLALPFLPSRTWLFTPRPWVGIVGLTCCLIITGLWIYSSFVSTTAITGSYGRSGMDEIPANDSPQGQFIIGDPPGAGSGSPRIPPGDPK